MSQAILERMQYKYNKTMGFNEIGKGTTAAKEFSAEYKLQMTKERQDKSKVTIQDNNIDNVSITKEIKKEVQDDERPILGDVPEINKLKISELQNYVNTLNRSHKMKEEHHISETTKDEKNVVMSNEKNRVQNTEAAIHNQSQLNSELEGR